MLTAQGCFLKGKSPQFKISTQIDSYEVKWKIYASGKQRSHHLGWILTLTSSASPSFCPPSAFLFSPCLCLSSYLHLLFLTVCLRVSISHFKFSAEFQPRESSMTLVKSFFSFVLQFSSLHDRKYNYSLQRDSKHSKTDLHKGKWGFQPVMGSLTHSLGLGLEGGQRLETSTIWSPSDASESLWWMVFWPWPLSWQSDSV